MISIHPPCGGRDYLKSSIQFFIPISIHPPCGGRDSSCPQVGQLPPVFQSTRPVGGGTVKIEHFPVVGRDFNPPALWGAGQYFFHRISHIMSYFNPPALWGAGLKVRRCKVCPSKFQSTRPVGGGTFADMEFDTDTWDFNPPARWGAGLAALLALVRFLRISIHPPCGGRDFRRNINPVYKHHFNPPALWGAGHSHA